MPPKHIPPSEPTTRSSKAALLEAAQEATQDRKARPGPPASPKSGRTAWRAFLAAVLVIAAAVLLAKPLWLVGPTPPSETPAIKAATATMALVEVVSQLQAYQSANGHLPTTLAEAGLVDSAITYRPGPAGDFEVLMQAGDSVVSIRTTDSLKTRVVDAIRTLQGRTLR